MIGDACEVDLVFEKQFDDRDFVGWSGDGRSSMRSLSGEFLLPGDVGHGLAEADFGGVVQELGVADFSGVAGQQELAHRIVQQVDVEAARGGIPRQQRVLRRGEVRRGLGAAVDGAGMQAHPAADGGSCAPSARGSMVPRPVGPMLRSRLPPLETVSISSTMSWRTSFQVASSRW